MLTLLDLHTVMQKAQLNVEDHLGAQATPYLAAAWG